MSSTQRGRFHRRLQRRISSASPGTQGIDYALVIRRIRILAASLVVGLLFEIALVLVIHRS